MEIRVNGKEYQVADEPDRTLLWVLRDELGLTGTKFGCGVGICGSCEVHLDGKVTRSCITLLSAAAGPRSARWRGWRAKAGCTRCSRRSWTSRYTSVAGA